MQKIYFMGLRISILLIAQVFFLTANAQDTITNQEKPDSLKYWKYKTIYSLNGTQSSFVNWNAGGRNNFSALGLISANLTYNKKDWKWSNDLTLALGAIKYFDQNASEALQKTDDKIEFATTGGYQFKEDWYYSLLGNFRTQFMDGFNFPNDSVRASRFMAPAYINIALGIEYSPDENLSLFLSPISAKITVVDDEVLSNAGAFGVAAATYNPDGTVLSSGKRTRSEYGAYFRLIYSKQLMENIGFKSKLELFSNYTENPQNVDVNAETLFTFKINKWFSSSLQWNLIYDDDIDITDASGNTGPRTQFKSILGLGISYSVQNFKDPD